MKSPVASLLTELVLLPILIGFLLIGLSYYFYSSTMREWDIRSANYDKYQEMQISLSLLKPREQEVTEILTQVDLLKSSTDAQLPDFLDRHLIPSEGMRKGTFASSGSASGSLDTTAVFDLTVKGKSGALSDLLTHLQNRFPNVQVSQISLAPDDDPATPLTDANITISILNLK